MIKHLSPFSEEHIKTVRENLTPIEKVTEDINYFFSDLKYSPYCYHDDNNTEKIKQEINKIAKKHLSSTKYEWIITRDITNNTSFLDIKIKEENLLDEYKIMRISINL